MFKFVSRVIIVAIVALAVGGASAKAQEAKPHDTFQRQVQPLLERYCVECHSEDGSEGGIALDGFDDQQDAVSAGRTWLRVLDALEGRVMPPADEPQPSLEETDRILDWIENDFLASQCRTAVTAHRS